MAAPSSALLSIGFEDPNPPKLPPVIKDYVSSWKKPEEVFPDFDLVVYDPTKTLFELSVPSPVAQCDFFTCFNELLPLLQFYALSDGFAVEVETPNFSSTTQGEPWRPWHHVYALCKAGKGQVHAPLYSSFGKYIVRLFYFGCWRKFVVDDRIPCDSHGLCMLPVTKAKGELWPILLAKALLKIFSLTGSMIDFPFLSFLTGWVNVHLATAQKSHEQIWRRLRILTPCYVIPSENVADVPVSDFTKKSSAKKDALKEGSKRMEFSFDKFCVVLAHLGGFNLEDEVMNASQVLVTMTRDTPLKKTDKRERTKPWKRLRWVYWALEKGIWIDELLLPPYRRIQYVTFSKKLAKILFPDPIQEATLYVVEEKDSEQESQMTSSNDDAPFEPKQWSDYYKFYDYLLHMNVLIKPSSCISNFRITSLKSAFMKRASIAPATAKIALKADTQNFHSYSPCLTPTLNQPLLLYCESSTGIFISFSLWVCPRAKKSMIGYLDPHNPEILKVGHATLIVEQFDWRTFRQGNLIGFIKTVGNDSIFLNLKPGRHVLKLWLSSDSPYTLNMYSNVDLLVHKGPKIRYQMRNESERIISYIADVSNAFLTLTQSFGKPELPNALKNFYETIKPGNDGVNHYLSKLDLFIEVFLDSIMLALKNLINNNDELKIMLGAMRSLFINPNIDCDLPPGPPLSLYGAGTKKTAKKLPVLIIERTLSEILIYPWTPEEIQQIIMIQRIFRGYRIRLFMKYQTPARKECKPYADKLKKIYDILFSPAKRNLEVGKLIRLVAMNNANLYNSFKFHQDFSKVIEVEEFTGKVIGVEPYAWVPIARFIVASHGSDLPTPCSFYLSCNLQQCMVLGVDNDTEEEIFLLTNTISPHYYKSNVKGYTIFVFGWNDSNVKTVNWRLEMVKMKHCQVLHLCNTMINLDCYPYGMPALEMSAIKNFYVPNHRCRLCRCTIKIQKRTLLTLRLSTSYSEVEFVLTIYLGPKFGSSNSENFPLNRGIRVKRVSVNGVVILPALVLESVKKASWWDEADDETTVYVLEAEILENSWPLTKQEWGVIEPLRVNGEFWKEMSSSTQLRRGGMESRKKSTRSSKRSLQEKIVENPFWLLQVVSDSPVGESTDTVVVEEDRSHYESIKAMKLSWEEKNPGRRKRGRDLRYEFLHEIFLENKLKESQKQSWLEAEGYGEEFHAYETEDFKQLLQKMISFSYLTSDKTSVRFAHSPRVLPPMPTEDLLKKYKRNLSETSVGFAAESSPSEEFDLQQNIITDDEEEEQMDYLSMRNNFRLALVNHLEEERKLSNRLMEQALKQRSKAIQRLTR